ncbi:MAG: M36 family metallopeptidase, partial [Planctomycetaceae bacterium]
GGGADYLEGGSGNDLIDSFLPQLTLILIDDPVVGAEGDSASLTVFSNGFEGSVPSEFSGFTSTTSVQGFAGLGTNSNVFAGDFLRNDTGCCGSLPTTPQTATRLTLTNLPSHESVDVDFLLAIINSWNDANDSSVWGPDHFVVTLDGNEIFNENFRNIDGSTQGYQPPAGVVLTPAPLTDLGFPAFPFGSLENNDSAYNMGLDPTFDAIPHTADTLTVEWYAGEAGWEGGANESWGIDNVEVTLNVVPVESTATFNVTLSHSSNDTISAYYTTVDDTALAGSDYVAATGTVTFNPGSTHETISVTVLGDTVAEGDETFEVVLSYPINAAIGDAQGVATITDDDAAGSLALANNFLADRADEIGIDVADLDDARVTGQYVSLGSGTSHIYLQQTHAGLDVQGATIGVHVSAKDELVALNSEFVQGLGSITPAAEDVQPQLTATEALEQVADQLGWMVGPGSIITLEGPIDNPYEDPAVDQAQVLRSFDISQEPIPVHLAWVPTDDGGIELVWSMTIERDEGPHLYDITASTTSGDILSQADRVLNYSYEVFAQPVANPFDAARSLEVDPQDAVSSPSGWHDDGTTVYTDTRGNNAIVQEDANSDDAGGTRPDGGASGVFAFPLDLTQPPSANEDAANTNAFYWTNIAHDIFYRYGFDEAAGNYQTTNFTGQGSGGDAMIVDIFDPAGEWLAGGPYFVPEPEGTAPRITLGANTIPDPDTMASLGNQILVHEYSHGISLRLVGGSSDISVLQNPQGRGLGEGWGDWHALMLHQKATDTPTTQELTADYYLQDPAGLRNYPYTTDMTVNPLTYESYNSPFPNGNAGNEIHNAGEIWASVLWDLNWLMVARCGFDADLYAGSGGNNTLLQLTMDAMKLGPTDPTFLDARDAILAADLNL